FEAAREAVQRQIRRVPSKSKALFPRIPLPKRYATCLTATLLLWFTVLSSNCSAWGQETSLANSGYEAKTVLSIDIPRPIAAQRDHLLLLLPQKVGAALDRDHIRESIRILYATGRFADIQAEVTPSGNGVVLSFVTSPNFFVGAVNVDGAPNRPNS